MLRMWLATALAALLLALPLGAGAAGLGRITVLSALGQPLRAEVEISATREELASFSARIASAAAFQQAGIEYSASLAGIRFNVGQRPNGQPVLNLTSDRAFNEPFLDLLVEATWSSGRLLREYTFLLDPPEAQQKTPGTAAAPVTLPEIKKDIVREAPASAPMPATTLAPAAPVAASVQAAPTQAPAPTAAAAAPETRPVAPVEDKAQKKSLPDLQVIRGADGVQRIVKVEPPTPEKVPKESVPPTRLVKQGDTLGKIAAETKPDGVNLDQMLVALFRGNQEAFVGNVNRLKAGKILNIPDRETVSGISADDAKRTIQAHSADFNAYSKKLAASVAGTAPQKEEAPQRAVSGKIAPKVEEKVPVAAGKDKLEVSKSEAAANKAGASRLAAIEETLVSREKALKDANSRIAELEKNLADLKKLIELKNQSMADLQKQAQAAKPQAAPVPVKEPAAAPQKPVVKEAEKPAPAVAPAAPPQAPAKPAEPASVKPAEPAATEKPAAETVMPASKPPAAEKNPAPPPPPPAAEPSFIDDSPEVVYGGSAVILLLLGYLGYSTWRKKKSAQASGDMDEPLAAIVDSGTDKSDQGEDLLSTTDFSSQPSGAAPNANVDPVAEAEVYLAYGRDVQAEEILVDALKTDPTRLAIHLKLLGIYATRKSVNQFDAIAKSVHGLTNGEGQDWEKTREMGLEVNPENPLYGGQQASSAEFDPDATMVIEPQVAVEDFAIAEEAPPQDMQMELPAEEAIPEPAADQAPEEAVSDDVPVSLDFDFDLPLAAQVTPASGTTEAPQVQDETPGKLDIDLGDAAALAPGDESAPAETIETPAAQEASTSLDIDFDLDLDAPQAVAAEPVPSAPPPAAADAGLDFNFDLDSSVPEASPAPAEPVQADAESVGNNIDFDLELPAPAAAAPVASNVDLSSINLDLDAPLEPASAPAAAQATEADDSAFQDVATKLELAQAYEEMGDKEGARELLQEVLTEGNAAQKETARSKLAQLG
ncbi:MAG: pilus assembly protein [Betaproteobacteria bacterium]|nr:pilus assembly protein [Betaproteobacteria bacterium]